MPEGAEAPVNVSLLPTLVTELTGQRRAAIETGAALLPVSFTGARFHRPSHQPAGHRFANAFSPHHPLVVPYGEWRVESVRTATASC